MPADRAPEPPRPRGAAWRRTTFGLIVAAGAVALAVLGALLAGTPHVRSDWRLEHGTELELVRSPLPALQPLVGMALRQLIGADGQRVDSAGLAEPTAVRWTIDDAARARQVDAQRQLARMLAHGPVRVQFADGRELGVEPQRRGLGGLGITLWVAAALALAMLALAARIVLRRPGLRSGLYAAMLSAQAASLIVAGIEAMPGLGLPIGFTEGPIGWRFALDLFTVAALVHLCTLAPLRVPKGRWFATAAWLLGAAIVAAQAAGSVPGLWWWTQAAVLGGGALAIGLCSASYRREPNPFALLARRAILAGVLVTAVLGVGLFAARRPEDWQVDAVVMAPALWTLMLALMLLRMPFVVRPVGLLRDGATLAGIGTVALSLDLLLGSLFEIDALGSLAAGLFAALALYGAARRWLNEPVAGPQVLGAGRMLDRLYRGLREIEAQPARAAEASAALLRDLFDPLDMRLGEQPLAQSRIAEAGARLEVPLPPAAQRDGPTRAVVLRFAGRGRRVFTIDDARLADRVVGQMQRALEQDAAVERGRSEERARIAQDLHDDIGARLLTLMYKAPSSEIEDYIRHTLKDLKTLTRGLAASGHRLSEAAAEWKTDIAQRLGTVQIGLTWSLHYDRDLELGVVQWSALTRVLRELVSNVIQHSAATHVEIAAVLEGGRLRLVIADDGIGRDPRAWAHGLGLGGVRKRVRQLGGDVNWAENGHAGIVCTVIVPQLGEPRS
jgi:signal transduction histidine kinase